MLAISSSNMDFPKTLEINIKFNNKVTSKNYIFVLNIFFLSKILNLKEFPIVLIQYCHYKYWLVRIPCHRLLPQLKRFFLVYLIFCLFYCFRSVKVYSNSACFFFPWKKKNSPLNSSLHLISSFIQECVSCRKINPFAAT